MKVFQSPAVQLATDDPIVSPSLMDPESQSGKKG
jgi:hypothetical protein